MNRKSDFQIEKSSGVGDFTLAWIACRPCRFEDCGYLFGAIAANVRDESWSDACHSNDRGTRFNQFF